MSNSKYLCVCHPSLPECWMLPLTTRTTACHVQISQCMNMHTPLNKHVKTLKHFLLCTHFVSKVKCVLCLDVVLQFYAAITVFCSGKKSFGSDGWHSTFFPSDSNRRADGCARPLQAAVAILRWHSRALCCLSIAEYALLCTPY